MPHNRTPAQRVSVGELATAGMARSGANADILALLSGLYGIVSLILFKLFWPALANIQAAISVSDAGAIDGADALSYLALQIILVCVLVATLVIWIRAVFGDGEPVMDGGPAMYMRRVLRALQRLATGLVLVIIAMLPAILAARLVALLLSAVLGPATGDLVAIIGLFALIPVALVVQLLVFIAIAHEALDRPLSLLKTAVIVRPTWFQGALFILVVYPVGFLVTALLTAPLGQPDPNTLGGSIAVIVQSAAKFCMAAFIIAGLAHRFLGLDDLADRTAGD